MSCSSAILNLSQTALHIPCDALWDWYNMADAKQLFSFLYNWSDNQRNYSTSWEFIKWILIGKAEDICDEQFFCPLFLNYDNNMVLETNVTVIS